MKELNSLEVELALDPTEFKCEKIQREDGTVQIVCTRIEDNESKSNKSHSTESNK